MPLDRETARRLAVKYVWWKAPEDALAYPERLIARVMDIGDFKDIRLIESAVGEEGLRRILTGAEIGQFRPRSWAFWHYRLGLVPPGTPPPPLPTRRSAR